MGTYIVYRLLLMFPTLIGITLVVFFVMAMAPGGVSAALEQEGQGMRPEERQALREYYNRRYGLKDPYWQQYLRWLNRVSPVGTWTPAVDDTAGYGFDVWQDDEQRTVQFGLKQPDLGNSYTRHRPVSSLVAEALPVTVLLNVLSFPIIYVTAILTGVYAGRHRGKFFDVSSNLILLGLWSIPIMWAGVMLIGFLANNNYLPWSPPGGLHATLAGQMGFLPTGAALGQTLTFSLYVLCASVAALALVLAGLAGIVLAVWGIGRLRRRGGKSWESMRSAMLFGIMAVAVAAVASLGVLAGQQGILATQMPGVERGWLVDLLWHLVLPVVALSYSSFALLSKLQRSEVLESLHTDFVRTARAKGVSEHDILWRHVLRNSLLPLITIAATLVPAMLNGSLIVEVIFSLNGMGKLMWDAIQARDREIILSVTFVMSILTLLSLILRDVLYALVDPRVTFD
jgi:peptide/nickel transport system permease protein